MFEIVRTNAITPAGLLDCRLIDSECPKVTIRYGTYNQLVDYLIGMGINKCKSLVCEKQFTYCYLDPNAIKELTEEWTRIYSEYNSMRKVGDNYYNIVYGTYNPTFLKKLNSQFSHVFER